MSNQCQRPSDLGPKTAFAGSVSQLGADRVAPWAWVAPSRGQPDRQPAGEGQHQRQRPQPLGMWNDTSTEKRNFIWENFANGNQGLFMDPGSGLLPAATEPLRSILSRHRQSARSRYENFRNNLGSLVRYSRKLNLANVNSRSSLSSTKFCLAQTPDSGTEYLFTPPIGGHLPWILPRCPTRVC